MADTSPSAISPYRAKAVGTPLQGAVYEISEARSGKVVDYITTDARGVAVSKPLPLGLYKIVEGTAPAYWQLSGTVFDETLEYSGQMIKLADYDKPSNLLTSSNYSYNLNAIHMQACKYVTDVYFDFGKVPVGFQSTANPTLTVQVLGMVSNGYQPVN